MKRIAAGNISKNWRRLAIAIVASSVAASVVRANPSHNIILVPPTDIPALASQSDDALLLHETSDGRTLLYIEQNKGSRLAAFDVTDPAHFKGEGSVELTASGPFDFVSALGKQTELIRFRQGREDAVLDLHRESKPELKVFQGLALQGSITRLGDAGFSVASSSAEAPSERDLQVVDFGTLPDLGSVIDVKQVRDAATNAGTGTTFLLTDRGLYLIRRPAVESDKKRRDQEWFLEHSGN
jgi:hypothetical protein